MSVLRLAVAFLIPLELACAAARTMAATQPTSPKTFDAQASDAKALAIADAVLAAIGRASWERAHEIRWKETVLVDGNVNSIKLHSWDRWNGRYQLVGLSGAFRGKGMFDLYAEKGIAWSIDEEGNPTQRIPTSDARSLLDEGRKLAALDSYRLCLPFKLKDPGVHLAWVEERPGKDGAGYDVIKMTYDPGVGPEPGDVYYVVVDKATHLVDSIEYVAAGKPDSLRLGYKWSDWSDVSGLKFATKRQNLGYAGEVIQYEQIKVSDTPDEELYVPQVTDLEE